MTKNFIWDLDGTLIDSYDGIVKTLYAICLDIGLDYSQEQIYRHVVGDSVSSFIKIMAEESGRPELDIKVEYSKLRIGIEKDIQPMENAKEILDYAKDKGYRQFIYTHRGQTTIPILERLGLAHYFEDVISSVEGFARKPSPDAIDHLVEKYDLDKESTYYIGDRYLDMECAHNAGINGVFFISEESFLKPQGYEDHVVNNLLEIKEI